MGRGTYAAATTPVVITIPYVGTAAPSGAITVADGYSNTVTIAASGVLGGEWRADLHGESADSE